MSASSVLYPLQRGQSHWILQLLRRNSETIVELTGITQENVYGFEFCYYRGGMKFARC